MTTEESHTEHEILSTDEHKVREMCLSLKKIDAPKDFDFKLKARIANSTSSDFQPRFGFAFRYAMPAFALVFALGFLAYYGVFLSPGNNQIIAQSSPTPQNPEMPANTLVSTLTPSESPQTANTNPAISTPSPEMLKVSEKPQVAENNPPKPKQDLRETKKDSFKGYKDFALTPEKQPNFNGSTFIPRNPQNIERETPMPVREVLSTIGINADFANGKWTVKSVIANSVGESSDVKENDVIEAIDNQPLSNETINAKAISGKTLTITRNGKKSQIKLRNKQ